MIVTIPIFFGTGIHTSSYLEDLSASSGLQSEREAEIGQKDRLWMTANSSIDAETITWYKKVFL